MERSSARWSWLHDTQLGFYLQIRRLRRAPTPLHALQHLLVIVEHSRLVRKHAPVSTCALVRNDQRSRWNDAVAEWQRRGDTHAKVRVSAERCLLLRRVGNQMELVISVKQTYVVRDLQTKQLAPHKVEQETRLFDANLSAALALMPELSAPDIAAGLRGR